MKVTKYQITETKEELTILLPPSNEKGILPILMIIATFVAGLVMEWCYFHDIISITPLMRGIFTLVLLSIAFVGLNKIYYLQRGYEEVVLNKRFGLAEFSFKGLYRFNKRACRLEHINFLGVVHPNNKYAFMELTPLGRVSNRNTKAAIIVSERVPLITDDEPADRDLYVGHNLNEQDAATVGKRMLAFLNKKT